MRGEYGKDWEDLLEDIKIKRGEENVEGEGVKGKKYNTRDREGAEWVKDDREKENNMIFTMYNLIYILIFNWIIEY